MVIAALTAITIVLGMRLMGTLLISSLIIFPSLSAMRVFKHFHFVVIGAAVCSVICFFAGMVASYCYELPSGASVVLVNMFALAVCAIAGSIINRLKKH